VPEKVRGMFDGLHSRVDGVPGPDAVQQPERGSAGVEARREPAASARETTEDREAVLRRARTMR
jgi:hypothetical protein